eukprot:Tbor_TRINITY_DN5379_c1_g1::TRINITY_DN5379_c1_g1_i1::g.4488::m.4488
MKMNLNTHFPSQSIYILYILLLLPFLVYITHITTASEGHQIPFEKVGCFTGISEAFLIKALDIEFDIYSTIYINVTDSCITHCESQGALFAAVTNHNICSCGVKYDSKKETTESVCNYQCDGHFTCGGPSAATLYKMNPKRCRLPKSDGYIEFGESCYRIEENPMKWKDAEQKCVLEKGHLASIHNLKESYFMLSLLTGFTAVSGKSPLAFWAGGIYHSGNGAFTWSDGSMFNFFNHWAVGQPFMHPSRDVCLNMKPGKTEGSWLTRVCTNTIPFICKRSIKDSIYSHPQVYQVRSGATTTCFPTNADVFLNNIDTVLARYPLVVGDVTGVTVQGRAPIPGTATYTHFNTESDPDKNTNPIFVTDSTRNLTVMKFDG